MRAKEKKQECGYLGEYLDPLELEGAPDTKAVPKKRQDLAVQSLQHTANIQKDQIALLRTLLKEQQKRQNDQTNDLTHCKNQIASLEIQNKILMEENIHLKNTIHDKSGLSPQRNRLFSQKTPLSSRSVFSRTESKPAFR
ncbi:MAG: hypothetical protein NTZ67_07210 [Gammaproteobacteria bacterium]|nr:hypothetical protein [Gammaproteobacteria bacterium]